MEFPNVDLSQIEKPQVSLFLCRPDKTIIAKLTEAYDININFKAFQVNELDFKLPLRIDQHNELVDNPHIQQTRYRYLIRLVIDNKTSVDVTEWEQEDKEEYLGEDWENYIKSQKIKPYEEFFRVSSPKIESTEDTDGKHYQCLSLVDELRDRVIGSYSVQSFTVMEVFDGKENTPGILTDTNWTAVDRRLFSDVYRSIDISSEATILDIILNNMVESYNMLPIFDTNNRTIYIYTPDQVGKSIDQNILRLSYKKYLREFDLEEEDAEFTTRLRLRGKDNLAIHGISPTGQPYIENFGYFKQGYDVEAGTSSPYWSDELCEAQILYENKIKEYEGHITDISLEFNGSSYVELQDNIDMNNDYFTIEAYLYLHNDTHIGSIIKSDDDELNLYVDQSLFNIVYSGLNINTNVLITPETWHHIALVYTEDELRFILNGSLQYTEELSQPLSGLVDKTIRIGQDLEGKLSDLRIWSRIRHVNEIERNINRRLTGSEYLLDYYYPMNNLIIEDEIGVDITSIIEDNNDIIVNTRQEHGYSNTDKIIIIGTDDYNGIYDIEVIDNDHFKILSVEFAAEEFSGTCRKVGNIIYDMGMNGNDGEIYGSDWEWNIKETFNHWLQRMRVLQQERSKLQIELFNRENDLWRVQDLMDVLNGWDTALYRYTYEVGDEPHLEAELTKNWYYFVMGNTNAEDISLEINTYLHGKVEKTSTDEISTVSYTNGINEKNGWKILYVISPRQQTITGVTTDTLDIEILNTNSDIELHVCKITEEEYNDDHDGEYGSSDEFVIFMGDVTDTQNYWHLELGENTTDPMLINVGVETLQTQIRNLYEDTQEKISVEAVGQYGKDKYFVVTVPYSIAFNSEKLEANFNDIIKTSTAPYMTQAEQALGLIDKYNEPIKQDAYDEQLALVDRKNNEVNAVNKAVSAIRTELSLPNNFTASQITERNNFIIEKTYSNNDIVDANDLLDAGKEYFKSINEPSLVLNLQVVNFMQIAESYYDYDKLFYHPFKTGLYDSIIVNHEMYDFQIQCMILEINYTINEVPEIEFVVSNVQKVLTNEEQFMRDLTFSTNAAAVTLNEKYKWDKANETSNEIEQLLSETWDAATRAIEGGVDNLVKIGRRGIRVIDPNDPDHIIAIVAGYLGISNDGGKNYRSVINADGVAAKRLIGNIILASEMRIINQGGNIELDEAGIKVFDEDGDLKIHIGNLGEDTEDSSNYGFYLKGRQDTITGQNHYLEWDGSQLNIGGNLDAVTGSFTELIAGGEYNYMKLYEELASPYMDFYSSGNLRVRIDEDSIRFYDEEEAFTGYIKAIHEEILGEDRSILDLASSDIATIRSYVNTSEIQRASTLQTNIYPFVSTKIAAVDLIAQVESYIELTQNIDVISSEELNITAEQDIVVETVNGNLDLISLNGIAQILTNVGVNIGSPNTFISVNSVNETINIQGETYDNIQNTPSIVMHGIMGFTHVNNSARDRVYKIQKNGDDGIGIINFKCE